MTHENPARRMTKGLALISNISINIYYVIHPKYIISELFVNVFIKFLYDLSRSSAVHGRMGAVRNYSRKPFQKDDSRTAIELKY
jgi:hypothetical protein